MRLKTVLLGAAILLAATISRAQTIPYTFANQNGNVSVSQIDTNFSYLLNYLKPGGTLLSGANTWSALQTFSGGISATSISGLTTPLSVGQGGTGANSLTGALKGNGSGAFSQAACADLSNGGTACQAATGTSGHALGFLDGANSWSGMQTFGSGANIKGECLNAYTVYGANGTAGDGARLQSALNAAQPSSGGPGCVFVPALGKPYIIDTGVSIPAGVKLLGVDASYFNGLTATIAQWTVGGTWFECTDAAHPCITIGSHGTTLDGINLIWNQAAPPTTGGYTPTTFPDGVYVTGTFFRIRNMVMVGGTRCINIDYTSGSGGGTYSELSDLKLGCLSTGIRAANINDNVYVNDVDLRPLWYMSGYPPMVTYLEANFVGLDVNYWDNPVLKAVQCFQAYACFKFTNGTAVGNTHSLYNGQLLGVQCNLVRICMLANGSPTVSFQAQDFMAQQDGGLTDTLFQLGTDNLDVDFGNLSVISTGGSVMTIGGGTSGNVKIGMLKLGTKVNGTVISGYGAGQTALIVNAGAGLTLAGRNVVRTAGAGSFIGGAGAGNVSMPTFCWNPFTSFGQLTVTGTGAWADLTADNGASSGYYGGFLQVRLNGQTYISTAQTGGTAQFRSGAFTTVTTTSVPAAATGWQTFDTNWVDIADTGSGVGRLQHNMTTGVQAQFGDITLCGR